MADIDVSQYECVVYWLFDDSCVCLWRHGYIGISTNWPGRLKNHRLKFKVGFQSKVIFCGTAQECRVLEYRLRPDWNIGWNYLPGGGKSPRAGAHIPEHVRQKMSEAAKNKPPMSDETREKLRIAATGRTNNGRLGQKKSAEERAKISEGHRGKKRSLEVVEAMSARMIGKQIHLGHRHSEETKRTISEKKTGVSIHSDEFKRKFRERVIANNMLRKGKPWSEARRLAQIKK